MCFKMRRASTHDYMVVQILVHLHFELVNSLLALDASTAKEMTHCYFLEFNIEE